MKPDDKRRNNRFHLTDAQFKEAGKKGRKASPWNASPMCTSKRAVRMFSADGEPRSKEPDRNG